MLQNFRKLNIRIVAMVLAVLLLLPYLPSASAAVTSGSCGDNLSWSFADGRLTITGSGKMTDYNQIDLPPWYDYRDQILYLSLSEGMTTVGRMAFFDCYNLSAVTVPSTVTDIGAMAFCQCRSMVILNLPTGLQTIGASAFELCDSLKDLRLPSLLQEIGTHAFYRCGAVQYVDVPATVIEMGSGIFAYCSDLISARIAAPLESVPAWTFYGCESLTSVSLAQTMKGTESNAFVGCTQLSMVYYSGSDADAQKLRESISEELQDFAQFGSISDEEPKRSGTATEVGTTEDGAIVIDQTTVNVTENATVSMTTTMDGSNASVAVNTTVVTQDGWDEVIDAMEKAVEDLHNESMAGASTGTIQVNGYVAGSMEVPQEVLEYISGSDIKLNIQTEDGERFKVDGNTINDREITTGLALSYSMRQLSENPHEQLKGLLTYQLRFDNSVAINAEVMIRLPFEQARKVATLYQTEEDGALTVLQSVVVDDVGYAHFYLGAVEAEIEYLISLDVPGIDKNSVIIPEELYGEYGITDLSSPVEYVITGRTSSWGMSGWQVGLILGGVMLVCIVGIGVFMYAQNKRKLKMGYIPELDDEDENQ